MLVLLPKSTNIRDVYAVDFDNMTFVEIVGGDKRNKIYRDLIPGGSVKRVPAIHTEVMYRRPHKASLLKKRYAVRWISASTFKRMLLERFGFSLVSEESVRSPAEVFEIVSSINTKLRSYYVVSHSMVYPIGFEPKNYKTNRFIINGPLVIFL